MKLSVKIAKSLSVVAVLASCAGTQPLRPLDYADAGTTALAINQGAVELNPVIGAAGDTAAPVVALGVKWVIRNGLAATVDTPEQVETINRVMDVSGAIGACNNLAWLTGAEGHVTLLFGALCGGLYWFATD